MSEKNGVTLVHSDCVEAMRRMDRDSVHAIVTDPPYGLEFMGKDWDRLDGEAWRTGGTFSKPGIGDRQTAWPSFGSGDTANATCAACGGRMRGAKRCHCENPDWKVKGKPLGESRVDSRQAQGIKMQAWHYAWAVEALRVLKPGGHLLAFGGTRTFHRLACALEDAGFEIRDCLMWVYGSGFPKSLDVSKAIDKAAGAKRDIVGTRVSAFGTELGGERLCESVQLPKRGSWTTSNTAKEVALTGAAVTDDAKRWQGWGTALKPAWEPIILARKPLAGTVAANVLQHGTGGLNIDGCRIPVNAEVDDPRLGGKGDWSTENAAKHVYEGGYAGERVASSPLGRWPANLIWSHHPECEFVGTHEVKGTSGGSESGSNAFGQDAGWNKHNNKSAPIERSATEIIERWNCHPDCPSRLFPQTSSGQLLPHHVDGGKILGVYGAYAGRELAHAFGGDSGSAARFFYCAKASQSERNGSKHPTVKPVALMRYLVRMVRPPEGGVILDPFAGSGTTAEACVHEQIACIAIERDAEYVADIHNRISKPEFDQRRLLS